MIIKLVALTRALESTAGRTLPTRGNGRWPSAGGVALGPWGHTALSPRLSLPLEEIQILCQ